MNILLNLLTFVSVTSGYYDTFLIANIGVLHNLLLNKKINLASIITIFLFIYQFLL